MEKEEETWRIRRGQEVMLKGSREDLVTILSEFPNPEYFYLEVEL